MALFGSNKKEKKALVKIKPTVVRTQNVAKELIALAKSYDTKVESLDFNIFEVWTYTRMNDGSKETEWEELAPDELYELDDESALLNPHFQIKQTYEIEVFSKKTVEDLYPEFKLAVGANATKCKVYLSITAGSKVTYNQNFERDLKVLINKRKLRSGILINIFDEMLDDAVAKIAAHVRVAETAQYDKNQTILIAESHEPTPTQNDELILHYDKKEDIDENKKMDYASRGFIQSVMKDELLIEYLKSKEGKPGRNCRGEYMKPQEPIVNHEPTFSIDETIKMVESDRDIKYYAYENGYIALEENKYIIKTDVDVGEISFKTTGSISSGLDSDVSINVKEADAVKDAIGTGMEVEVSEIDIEGNVGSNAKVVALKANVGGQTHKTATIRADKLNINVHKGNAFGKNIHVTRLEHGVIDGDNVDVTQALGGNIRAKEVIIEVCASYVKATASKLIEIKKLQGSENVFTIDPLVKKDAQQDVENNEEEIKNLKIKLRDIDKEIKKYTIMVKNGLPAFNDLKKRLVHYKKSGVKMPDSFVKKYKQFTKMKEHLDQLKEDKKHQEQELERLSMSTTVLQENIFDARVINRNRWVGHNEIIFKMVNPPMEFSYKPQEGSQNKIFALVEVDEGEYEIQAVEE